MREHGSDNDRRREANTAETGVSSTVGPTKISADSAAGFNFPYYLYAPSNTRDNPMLVETVNTGGSGTQQQALDAADSITSSGIARTISDSLQVPLLAPAFPNPNDGDFYSKFIQALDTETMHIDSGDYERVDLQLLAMVDDARSRLTDQGIDTPPEFMLNGFSASGDFVKNFAVLHPDRIASATGGAVNGMTTLPLSQARGETINYQIGVADLESVTGSAFDESAWQTAPQFYYMGANERSPWDDTLPFRDVWSKEQADKARRVYGDNMQQERMVYSERLHREAGGTTRYEVYDGNGHEYDREIFEDILTFHRRHNGYATLRPITGHTAGSTAVTLDIVVHEQLANPFEARAFVNGTEASVSPVTVVGNTSNRVTLDLESPLSLDDTLEVGVFEQGQSDLSNAVLADSWTVEMEAEVVTEPTAGDSAIEISYSLSSEAASSMDLYLLTDNGTLVYQRSEMLTSVSPDTSDTQTFQLAAKDEGVPFQNGDELEIGFTPGRVWKATPTDTVTVGDGGAYAPDSCSVASTITHDQVDVSFAERPTLGDESVTVSASVDSSYDKTVALKLIPDTGAGRWGLESRDPDYDRLSPGDSVSGATYEFPPDLFAPTDTLALGELVELRAYPDGWTELSDFVASDCAIIDGIRFAEPPETGDSEVVVEFMYPEGKQDTGTIQLDIDGTQTATLDSISPGTLNSHTFSLSDGGVPSSGTVSVSLRDGSDNTVDTASETALPESVAGVSFAEPPIDGEHTVKIAYQLDSDYSNRAMVRLYSPDSAEWGVYLGEISPGESKSETVSIPSDEPVVPFTTGEDVAVALVDPDDPYRTAPLTTDTETTLSDRDSIGEVDVTASGDLIGVEEDATVTIESQNTAEIVVDGLWSGWNVTNTEPAGGQFTRNGRTAVFTYDSPTTAFPTMTIRPNPDTNTYQGGDYLLELDGTDGETTVSDSVLLTIDPTLQADFAFQSLSADDAVEAGSSVSASAVVENVGNIPGSTSVAFSLDTQRSESDVTDLAAGDTETVSTTFDTSGLSSGRYDLLAELDSETTSTPVDVFVLDSAGLYGSVVLPDGVTLGETSLTFQKTTDGRESVDATVDANSQFYVSDLPGPTYDLDIIIRSASLGEFDGVPALLDVENSYTVTSEMELLGQYDIPRGYRTEVRFVDQNGNPVSDFSSVDFSTQRGYGLGSYLSTTDSEGYVVLDGSNETGISVPASGKGDLDVQGETSDGEIVTFGTIYGSETGETFTFEIDPSRY